MRPHKRNEAPRDGDGLRAGFEVHVIGGARHAPAPEAEDGKGLEIGLRIGGGPKNAAPGDSPAGPVQRLEAEDSPEPLRARPISEAVRDVGPAVPYVSRRQHKERSLTTWTLWMAGATCALAVAAVAGVMVSKAKQAQQPQQTLVFAPQESFGKEKAYFIDHMNEAADEAEALLEQYAKASSPEAVLPLVRDASRVKDRLTALWQPMGPLSASVPVEPLYVDGEVRPYLMLKGRTAAFAQFAIVFVREDEHLKIDWEASHGIGDAQLSELRNSSTVVKDVKVRVVVQPGNFYTAEFPETDYSSFQLVDATGENFVWAFVRKGSRTADQLEAEFNQRSVLLEKTSENPATLRISGPLRKGVNLFEITEMLHKGWVSP